MNHIDPAQERGSSLRRSRVAQRGLVAGAVAGSLGIAGALGLSAAANPATHTTTSGNTGAPAPKSNPNLGDDGKHRALLGDDAGGGEQSDDGGGWVPSQPSPQFGGGTGGSQGGTGGQGGSGSSSGSLGSGGGSGGSGSLGSGGGGSGLGSGGGGTGGGGGVVTTPHATTGGS